MKRFTVVFPVARHHDEDSILLGMQPEGKPLHGYLNGYGGKVEEGESVEEAAVRELTEELGITPEHLRYIGSLTHEAKEVFFYLTEAEYREYGDSEQMIDNTWYQLSDEEFITKMLPGDQAIIAHVRSEIEKYWRGESLEEFHIKKDGEEIGKAVSELDKSLYKKH